MIDAIKKTALSRLILDNIISTEPGELLDEKLSNVVLPAGLGERQCQRTLVVLPDLFPLFSSSTKYGRFCLVGDSW